MNKVVKLEDYFGDDAAEQSSSGSANALPECPDFLSELAQKHWPELVASLGRQGIINELDRDVLAIYCSLYARFIELDERLNDPEGPGMTQLTKTGYEAETATFTAWKSMVKPIMSYAKQLGLTPPSRLQLQAKAPGQEELSF